MSAEGEAGELLIKRLPLTLDQALLIALVVATLLGVIIAFLGHKRQAAWRQKDRLGPFFDEWAKQIRVPTLRDAIHAGTFMLAVAGDPLFTTACKVAGKGFTHQYQDYLNATREYIGQCNALYNEVEKDCCQRTGLPIGRWRRRQEWPKDVLDESFVHSVFTQLTSAQEDRVRLEGIQYKIGAFNSSSHEYTRQGVWLEAKYSDFSGTLAEMTDEETPETSRKAKLERLQSIHTNMMVETYGRKFADKVAGINQRRQTAEALARQVRATLKRLAVS